MTTDPTETLRREIIESGTADALAEAARTRKDSWSTEELRAEFKVHAFLAPFVEVTRVATGERGTLMFGSDESGARVYHSWVVG